MFISQDDYNAGPMTSKADFPFIYSSTVAAFAITEVIAQCSLIEITVA